MTRSVLLFLAVSMVPLAVSAEPLRHVRLETEDPGSLASTLERAGYDVLEGSVTAGSLDLIVTAAEQRQLEHAGHALLTLAEGRPFSEIEEERLGGGVPPGYPNLDEVVIEMIIAAATFPSICRVVDLTVDLGVQPTFEGRHLYAVKISDNVDQDEDEPAFLMVGAHHCREVVTPVIALHAIEQLTTRYGSDPAVTDLVDSHEIWIAPVWNVDGYVYVFESDNMWRKNRRVFPGGTGADLNRNYPHGWDNPCSGSSVPSSATYKGPKPASEAETQTMLALSRRERFAKVLDYHSSGREVLHGYSCWSHPFDAYLEQEAIGISTAAGYGGDRRPPSADGEHYQWQFGLQGAYGFLMETHTEFQPPHETALAEAAQVWPATVWMLQRPLPLWGYVTDATYGDGIEAMISYLGVTFPNGETNRSGGPLGRYHAFLPAGSYDVVFEADGFDPQTVTGVVIDPGGSTRLDVALRRSAAAVALETRAGDGALLLAADPLGRTLRYRIQRPAHVSLRIFDVRGANVRTLVDGRQTPGLYDVRWNGQDDRGRRVASGGYVYRLRASGAAVHGKMLLVR